MIPIAVLCTDRVIPTGAFTSPAAGNVSGVIAVTVTAADNDAVAGVQFQIDGTNIGAMDTSAPYSVNYDTRALLNGSHTFSAIIYDRVGNSLTITRTVTFANAPVVTITAPGNGATVSGTIAFSANVTFYDATCSTQFKIDGGNYGGAQGGSGALSAANVDTMGLGNGSNTFSVTSTDGHGNTTTATNTVTVTNQPPAIPDTAGPTGGGSGEGGPQGGYGAFFPYGVWKAKGYTLQYSVWANLQNDQGKGVISTVNFDDGGFVWQDVEGTWGGNDGTQQTVYSGWYNVPIDSSHANLRAQLYLDREPGGSTTTSFYASAISFRWV